jgi:hypothetical protein
MRYPGYSCLILRRTFPELERSLIRRSLMIFPRELGRYNDSKHIWRFINGSILEFGYCESENDVSKYQSAEYDAIGFDESTHFTGDQITYMISRIRGVNDYPKSIDLATNPGNVGHGFHRSKFVKALIPFKIGGVLLGERTYTAVFIPAKVQDNKFLVDSDPEYINRLDALPENQRRMLRDGDWDVFEGQAFPEWRAEKDGKPWHVVPPFAIPANAKLWRSGDWGFTKPFAFLWYAKLDDGITYVYREHYGCVPGKPNTGIQMQASEVGRVLHSLERDDSKIAIGYLDPSCFSKTGHDGPSIADALRGTKDWPGAFFDPAHNDRINGKMRIHELLATDPDKGLPKLRIFSTCTNLIRTLPELPIDEVHVEDIDTDAEDHAYDALRYGLYRRISKPMTDEERRAADKAREKAAQPRVSERTGY